jgi:hypothetical protein
VDGRRLYAAGVLAVVRAGLHGVSGEVFVAAGEGDGAEGVVVVWCGEEEELVLCGRGAEGEAGNRAGEGDRDAVRRGTGEGRKVKQAERRA